MQQAVHSTQNFSQLIKLDCKRLNQTPTCKNWLILLFQKIDITEFLWGRLRGIAPTTFWPWGQSPPSPSWSRRLCSSAQKRVSCLEGNSQGIYAARQLCSRWDVSVTCALLTRHYFGMWWSILGEVAESMVIPPRGKWSLEIGKLWFRASSCGPKGLASSPSSLPCPCSTALSFAISSDKGSRDDQRLSICEWNSLRFTEHCTYSYFDSCWYSVETNWMLWLTVLWMYPSSFNELCDFQ